MKAHLVQKNTVSILLQVSEFFVLKQLTAERTQYFSCDHPMLVLGNKW